MAAAGALARGGRAGRPPWPRDFRAGAGRRADAVDELRNWCLLPDSRGKLQKVKGIGEKTADYIAMLAGAQAVAVDRRIGAFAGSGTDQEIRGLLAAVATALDLNLDLGVLDRVVWAAGKAALPPDSRPDTVTVAVPADRAARFHDLAERWLQGRANAEWRATDHELAIALWQQLDDRRRRLFGVLIPAFRSWWAHERGLAVIGTGQRVEALLKFSKTWAHVSVG